MVDTKINVNYGRQNPLKCCSVCPTLGCDGSGHITGKWTSHYKLSGCPNAEINKDKLQISPPKTEELAEHIKQLNNGRPLYGPGSGRGRKKYVANFQLYSVKSLYVHVVRSIQIDVIMLCSQINCRRSTFISRNKCHFVPAL